MPPPLPAIEPAPVDVTGQERSVRQLVTSVAGRLGSESEAKWIVAHAVGVSAGAVFAVFDEPVSVAAAEAVQEMTERRLAGEPLQYVLGVWSFRELEVRTDARALVPRPETEQVVEVALAELQRRSGEAGTGPVRDVVAVDLGTGSGVIALSLALEGPPGLEVWATDVSTAALELARSNLGSFVAAHRSAGTVQMVEGPWFEALPPRLAGQVDLVVSNPPYVSVAEWSVLDPVVRDHEPRSALVPGPSGREALESLVDDAGGWLAAGGSLVLELAPHQAPALAERAGRAGYVDVEVRADLSGRDRILVARRPR